jgi:D-glycero-D-manno-heptose 1,7-bisphosphate phosphatase
VSERSLAPAYLTAGADGIWSAVYRTAEAAPRAALFLDRDGVLVDEVGHLHRPDDVRLLPGAADLVGSANRAGVAVVVVTNQAGIGRGLYDWPDFEAVRARIDSLLEEAGAWLDAVYACPFHPSASEPYRHEAHPGRKPGPGMIFRAGTDLGIDLARSWIVGDTLDDMEAGRAAGLAGGVHVLTGHGRRDRPRVLHRTDGSFELVLADDLMAVRSAIPLIRSSRLRR